MICPSGSQNSGEHWIPRPSVSQWTSRRRQGPRAAGQGSCRRAIRGEPPPAGGAPCAPAQRLVAPSLGEVVAWTGSASSGVWLAPLAVGLRPLRVPSGAETPRAGGAGSPHRSLRKPPGLF